MKEIFAAFRQSMGRQDFPSPNNPVNESEQGSSADSNASRQGFTIGQIGILIIQAFAIFVAFSTLLGLIYSREYLESLGVPWSDFRLSTVDYATMSPDVAIMGVGVGILSLVAVVSFRWEITPSNGWKLYVFGLALSLTYSVFVLTWFLEFLPEPGRGALGIWFLTFILVWILCTAMLVSGATAISRGLPKISWIVKVWQTILSLIVLSTGVATLGLIIFWTGFFSSAIGRADAAITLREAPDVKVQFTSPSMYEFLTNKCDESSGVPSLCVFELVLLGDDFVYLRSPGEPYQYAIPKADIAGISYTVKP